jgi:hypothetical protein
MPAAMATYGPTAARSRRLTPRPLITMLVLPASLLPVTLLGPGELAAPRRLAHQTWADVVRLQRGLQPAHHRAVAPAPALARVSFGRVYGRWRRFPQPGRKGLVRKGPLQ